MLARWQEWLPPLIRVALTILIVVALWVALDPIGGLLFGSVLVAVVWGWNRSSWRRTG